MTRKKEPGKKKDKEPKKPKVHPELEGFEIKVNPLGEISSNYSIEQLNEFLNKTVRDKKLVHRKDLGFEPVGAAAEPDEDEIIDDEEAYGYDEDDMEELGETDDPNADLLDDAELLDDDYDEMAEDPNFDEFDEEDK
jgi:hypothetical protein